MKKIMTILLAILFILSITLNIIIFSSSYGTLLFKYDRTKFKSLINLNSSKLDISKFFLQKETGIQINYEYKDNDGHIMFSLINLKEEDLHIKKGDAIGQAMFT